MLRRRVYSSRLLRCPEWGKNFITVVLTTTHVLQMNLIIQNACLKMLIKTHLEIFWASQSIHCRPRNLHAFESTGSALKTMPAGFICCCPVIKSCLTLWPHGQQYARLSPPSLSPGVCLNSSLLSWWCYPTMSPSTTLFFWLQSFSASGSFPMSWLFMSDDQSFGASASASVLPMNIQGWFPLGLTGLISLLSKGLSRVFSSTTVRKHQFFST